ncbi:hypothetical protein MMC16_003440 [Acarospora aff. strigata]|nr:hypothetical protein [Acarospora aff. strigata]
MAAEFLAGHGIDLQKEISNVQFGHYNSAPELDHQSGHKPPLCTLSKITGVRLPLRPPDKLWDVSIASGKVNSINEHNSWTISEQHLPDTLDAREQFLAPSLCHPHIHLDKCFLLSDPKYADLKIVKGGFSEAMELTNKAKARFEEVDLLRRGRWLIDESIAAGVTHMRAFVEVDEGVGFKCLNAGLKLKAEYSRQCEVQICAFAQLPLFSGGDGGEEMRRLMEGALGREAVDVVGSTPYVEADEERMKSNVEWTIETALKQDKHLDFHLDYNLDANKEPLIWFVLQTLKDKDWMGRADREKTIVFGHCTRLTLLKKHEWMRLKDEIGDLPIHFVGLPTSDLFMMGRPADDEAASGERVRGTLQIPEMVQEYGLDGTIGVNNVGNAFTPQGSCDPMTIASLAVGIYQAGTKTDAELIYVSGSSSVCSDRA